MSDWITISTLTKGNCYQIFGIWPILPTDSDENNLSAQPIALFEVRAQDLRSILSHRTIRIVLIIPPVSCLQREVHKTLLDCPQQNHLFI